MIYKAYTTSSGGKLLFVSSTVSGGMGVSWVSDFGRRRDKKSFTNTS
jgi:hypothetical protein